MIEITDWAAKNNMTPQEFKNEIAATMAVIGSMEIDDTDGEFNTAIFRVEDNKYKYKVSVFREAL